MSDSPGTQAATPDQLKRSADLSASSAPAPVCVADRYELQELLARGGMGTVHAAYDRLFKRTVAVKLMHAGVADEHAVKRFRHESLIAAQLQHPSIPPVYDLGTDQDGRPFLVMKLVKGRTLDDHVKHPGPDTPNLVAAFEGVAQAVGYAHSRGVLHRDVKPLNVMVGAFGEVQVMDWGLAKFKDAIEEPRPAAAVASTFFDPRTAADSRTSAGSVLGTPAYMPPEQAIGAVDQITERSDVFGLGAVLCAILTGKPVFVGSDAEATRQMAAKGRTQDALARLNGCGAEPELVALTAQCLAVEPADRPANGTEVTRAVGRIRAAADDRAKQAELRRARSDARRRVLAWSAAAVFAVLSVGIAGTTIGLLWAKEKERDAVKAADEERKAKLREADERTKAEKAYTRTAEVLDVMVSEVTGESLATQKTITDQQRKFLSEVLTYYRDFAGVTGDDEKTRARTTQAALRVGLIESRLGRMENGAIAFQSARDGYEKLVADFPAVPDYRRGLARSHNYLGNLLADFGKRSEAEWQYRSALAIRERLAADFPAVPDYRRDLAHGHDNLGVLLSELGNLSEAEGLHRKALAVHAKLAADFPAVPDYRRDLARGHNYLGNRLAGLGKRSEAEGQYRMALAVHAKLAADFPAVPDYRRDLAGIHNNLGLLLSGLGKRSEAEEQHLKALAIRERLAADFPAVPEHRVELGISYKIFGELFCDSNRPAESLPWFQKAVDTLRPAYEVEPRAVTVKNSLRTSHWSRAEAYDRLQRFAEAGKDWDKAVELSPKEEQSYFRASRAVSRLNAGMMAEAVAEVAELTKSPNWKVEQWYDFARVYSVASGKVAEKKQEYADRAMELLARACATGYRDAAHMKQNPDLDPLRERADFKKLLAELEAKFPPKREPAPPPRAAK